MSRPVWRTFAVGALLLVLLVAGGHGLVRTVTPAMQSVFESLMGEFRVLRFGVDQEGGDAVLRVEVTRSSYVLMGGRAIEPNSQGTANASTLALQTLFGPFLALWVTLASGVHVQAATTLARSIGWKVAANSTPRNGTSSVHLPAAPACSS